VPAAGIRVTAVGCLCQSQALAAGMWWTPCAGQQPVIAAGIAEASVAAWCFIT
jgi:hypothetical protein